MKRLCFALRILETFTGRKVVTISELLRALEDRVHGPVEQASIKSQNGLELVAKFSKEIRLMLRVQWINVYRFYCC